jgi:hypothetical protein
MYSAFTLIEKRPHYRAPGSGGNERIRFAAGLGAGPVHRLGDFIGRMARHVLFQGVAEQLAPGLLAPPREPLGSVEDFIGNRDRSFHTFSITAENRIIPAL